MRRNMRDVASRVGAKLRRWVGRHPSPPVPAAPAPDRIAPARMHRHTGWNPTKRTGATRPRIPNVRTGRVHTSRRAYTRRRCVCGKLLFVSPWSHHHARRST